MTPAILTLFNCLTDGIAIIANDATVRFANEGMQRLIPAQPGMPFPQATVAAVIAQALDGHLTLPYSFKAEIAYDPEIAAPEELQVHVVRSPAGKDLVVIIRDLSERRIYETTIANLGGLVDCALAEPLHAFSAGLSSLLEDVAGETAPASTHRERLSTVIVQGQGVLDQLRNLASLAQFGRGKALEADDRIILGDWLTAALARREDTARARGQRLTLQTDAKSLPTIYGSAYWLGLALDACLDNAVRHSESGSEIVLSALGNGNFVRITLRNKGRGLQPRLLRSRLMQPLIRGKAASEASPGLGLGLPLARQIIELHLGRLALEQELDGFVTCTMELPAGVSPHSDPGLDLAQAQRYASDLVRLMAQRSSRQDTPAS
jgi:signal transduction histidine kinase